MYTCILYRFIIIMNRKNLSSSIFLRVSFSSEDNVRTSIQFQIKGQYQHLKKSYCFIITEVSLVFPALRLTSSITVSKVKRKLGNPHSLFPQSRNPFTEARVSISINCSITCNIIKEIINI